MAASVLSRAIIRQISHQKPTTCTAWLCKVNSKGLSTTSKLCSAKLFSEQHEWITVDGNVGTIGISHYAQDKLGDVVYAQLPDVGAEIAKNDECGVLESVKAASEIYTPVSGQITEANTRLEDEPDLINKSCYEDGWLFKLELTKPEELDQLMKEDAYHKFLKSKE